jgi:hypothetical protein
VAGPAGSAASTSAIHALVSSPRTARRAFGDRSKIASRLRRHRRYRGPRQRQVSLSPRGPPPRPHRTVPRLAHLRPPAPEPPAEAARHGATWTRYEGAPRGQPPARDQRRPRPADQGTRGRRRTRTRRGAHRRASSRPVTTALASLEDLSPSNTTEREDGLAARLARPHKALATPPPPYSARPSTPSTSASWSTRPPAAWRSPRPSASGSRCPREREDPPRGGPSRHYFGGSGGPLRRRGR